MINFKLIEIISVTIISIAISIEDYTILKSNWVNICNVPLAPLKFASIEHNRVIDPPIRVVRFRISKAVYRTCKPRYLRERILVQCWFCIGTKDFVPILLDFYFQSSHRVSRKFDLRKTRNALYAANIARKYFHTNVSSEVYDDSFAIGV